MIDEGEEALLRREFDAEILRKHYLKQDPEAVEQQSLQGLQRRRERFKKLLDTDTDLYLVYHSANIAATWLSFLSVGLLDDLAEPGEQAPLTEQVAALAFFSRLANDLWAIIELVELGFDLQARALTRAYLEHVDVLICCTLDKELTREFVEAGEPSEANAFWHKHVSKNRAKAKVSKFIAQALGVDKVSIVDELREDAEFAGSALLHPTVTAGIATALGHHEVDYESYPIFPEPMAASAGTLRTILVHLFWLSFAMGAQPQGWCGEWRPIFRTERLRDDLMLRRRQLLYSSMFAFLLDNHILMRPVADETSAL